MELKIGNKVMHQGVEYVIVSIDQHTSLEGSTLHIVAHTEELASKRQLQTFQTDQYNDSLMQILEAAKRQLGDKGLG